MTIYNRRHTFGCHLIPHGTYCYSFSWMGLNRWNADVKWCYCACPFHCPFCTIAHFTHQFIYWVWLFKMIKIYANKLPKQTHVDQKVGHDDNPFSFSNHWGSIMGHHKDNYKCQSLSVLWTGVMPCLPQVRMKTRWKNPINRE